MRRFLRARYNTGMKGQAWLQVLCVVVAAMVLVPQTTEAARLYADRENQNTPEVGDTFLVPIRIDPEDTCINAVELTLTYDPAILSAVDVTRGTSIFSLWVEAPEIDKETGRITLSGGIPGGYCGRVQGDPGLTNRIAEVVFTAIDETRGASSSIAIEAASVYAHDGLGTPVPTIVERLELTVAPDETPGVTNTWLALVSEDTVAPELFEIVLNSDPSVENGKYHIIFKSLDKQSGIDHYEVIETNPEQWGFLSWIAKPAHWVVAESPYILRDQKLRSTVQVKALDKAGNERVVTFRAPEDLQRGLTLADYIGLVLLVGVVVLVLLVLWVYLRRPRPIKSVEPETQWHDDE